MNDDELNRRINIHLAETDNVGGMVITREQRLEAALADMFALIDEGYFVRDISDDAAPGFAMRQLPFFARLAKNHAALSKVQVMTIDYNVTETERHMRAEDDAAERIEWIYRLRTLGDGLKQGGQYVPAMYRNKKTGRLSYRIDLYKNGKWHSCVERPTNLEAAQTRVKLLNETGVQQ